jgi:hypothetical protein
LAIEDVRRAVHELEAARYEPEDFYYRFRTCVVFLMAVGPIIDLETPKAPKYWWKPHLQPDASDLMDLRTSVLKQFDHKLDTNFVPASPTEAASMGMTGTAGVVFYKPAWRISSGPYEGRDPIELMNSYLARLERLLPEAEQYA